MEVRVGGVTEDVTPKETLPLVPAAVVTEMLCCPTVAFAAMSSVAVALVALTTETFETVMPEPALTVRGDVKPFPVRVTGTEEP